MVYSQQLVDVCGEVARVLPSARIPPDTTVSLFAPLCERPPSDAKETARDRRLRCYTRTKTRTTSTTVTRGIPDAATREEASEVGRPWRDADGRTGARLHGVRANFTAHVHTITITIRGTRHDTTRHDTSRHGTARTRTANTTAETRPGASRARRPRRPAHPDIILGPPRAAFPVLRHLSSFSRPPPAPPPPPPPPPLLVRRLRLLGRFPRSRRANDSPPRFLSAFTQQPSQGSSRSALTAQLDGVRRRLTATAGLLLSAKMATALRPQCRQSCRLRLRAAPARPANREPPPPPPALGGSCDVIAPLGEIEKFEEQIETKATRDRPN